MRLICPILHGTSLVFGTELLEIMDRNHIAAFYSKMSIIDFWCNFTFHLPNDIYRLYTTQVYHLTTFWSGFRCNICVWFGTLLCLHLTHSCKTYLKLQRSVKSALIRWLHLVMNHEQWCFSFITTLIGWHPGPSYNNDVIISAMASQITSLTIVYSGANQRKHQSSASLAFVLGIHRWPVNSPHKGPVTRKIFPFDDVIIH